VRELKYFTPHEFIRAGRQWWPDMDQDLLLSLDVFRGLWGAPVYISPHPLALGRHDREHGTSQHNIDRWRVVRAADIMPEGMTSVDAACRAVEIAEDAGMVGIGLYPHWSPRPGLHVDVRHSGPARWGAVKRDGVQIYTTLDSVLSQMEAVS
jgi:hypothetical protein